MAGLCCRQLGRWEGQWLAIASTNGQRCHRHHCCITAAATAATGSSPPTWHAHQGSLPLPPLPYRYAVVPYITTARCNRAMWQYPLTPKTSFCAGEKRQQQQQQPAHS